MCRQRVIWGLGKNGKPGREACRCSDPCPPTRIMQKCQEFEDHRGGEGGKVLERDREGADVYVCSQTGKRHV